MSLQSIVTTQSRRHTRRRIRSTSAPAPPWMVGVESSPLAISLRRMTSCVSRPTARIRMPAPRGSPATHRTAAALIIERCGVPSKGAAWSGRRTVALQPLSRRRPLRDVALVRFAECCEIPAPVHEVLDCCETLVARGVQRWRTLRRGRHLNGDVEQVPHRACDRWRSVAVTTAPIRRVRIRPWSGLSGPVRVGI